MIRLGDKVEDRVTGLVGIAVARIEYLNGCVQWCLQPRVAEDAMKIDSHYIDEGQLKRIGDGINPPMKKLAALDELVRSRVARHFKVTKEKRKPSRDKRRRSGGGPSVHVPKQMVGPKP